MSSRRIIPTDQRYVHFLTFSVARRRRLLDLDEPRRIVLGKLNHQLKALKALCVGFVIMPEHVHALIWLSDSCEISRFMHGWKRLSSYDIRRWYEQQCEKYFAGFGMGDRLWLPKYHAFQIHSRSKLEEKLDYMHLNPVRAGLVERAEDWPWSSARWYSSKVSVGVPINWVEC